MNASERHKLFERIIKENTEYFRMIAEAMADNGYVQDLHQEIMLAIWKSLDSYQGKSSLSTWAHGVAINTARYFCRKNSRPETPVGAFMESSASTAYNSLNRDPAGILEEFSGTLASVNRQVFNLFLDDISYREMSMVTRLSEVNLRKRISRLKQQFTARYIGR